MAERVIYTDTGRFDTDVLQSDRPVILDFYSEDCPPCTALAPIFERLAEKYGDQIRFVKIFRQQNRALAESYGVRGSPTILFFREGKEVGPRLTGYVRKPELRRAIEGVLGESLVKGERQVRECDLLILGGGPAGLTAALYAARARLSTVVIEEGITGGQAATTHEVANYPGTGGSISGRELMDNMLRQATAHGAVVKDLEEVMEVLLAGERKLVRTEDADYHARAVIIATGAEPRKLPAEGEDRFRGRGVHYCATCDGAMYEGKRLLVVGGGNSAVEEAVYLTRFATRVTVVHEFDHLQASRTAQEEALANPRIDFVWGSHVRRIIGDGHLTGVTLERLKDGTLQDLQADGIFVYIGTQPRSGPFRGQVNLNEGGYILTDENMRTGTPGVFAAGDVRAKEVRQVITAAGDGAMAAVMAERYLATREIEARARR